MCVYNVQLRFDTNKGRQHTDFIPVRYPVICLSKPLNCCLYLSLDEWGTAQSLGIATMGDITVGDDEAELK